MSFDNRHVFNKFFVHKIASLSSFSYFSHSQCADLMSISPPCFAFDLDLQFSMFEFELWSFQLLAILVVTDFNQIIVSCSKTTSPIWRIASSKELSLQKSLDLISLGFISPLNAVRI